MANYTYTEDISGGSASNTEKINVAKSDAQAVADSKGVPVTGTYILSSGENFTYTAYPSQQQAGSSSLPAAPAAAPTNTPINPDTQALIQRGNIRQPGFYGSQELRDSNDFFNQAVSIAANLAGIASSLQSTPAPADYVRTPNSPVYYLTDAEKEAIRIKSSELATFGVIPLDILVQFFYILAANESLSDLIFIANVVGIPELGDQRYIRNIRDICLIPDIYKIGYLANGVASVINRFAPKYESMREYSDSSKSDIADIIRAVSLANSLGVMGGNILNTVYTLDGYSGPLRDASTLKNSSINDTVNAYSQLANGNPTAGLSPSTINAVLNPASSVKSQATQIGAQVIGSLLSQTPLGGALSALGPLGGIALDLLLGKFGGQAIGAFMSEVITGNRLATTRRANNPMLQPPSYAGKAFFGESPVSLPAVDQIFCRKVAAFGTSTGGSGTASFGMQNFASFGGSLSMESVVSRFLTGSSTPPPTNTFFGQQVSQLTSNLCNNLNVPITSNIELRRSDNAIPFMIGMSATILESNFTPFGSTPFTDGWKLAASTANDIQNYNPDFLSAAWTSL